VTITETESRSWFVLRRQIFPSFVSKFDSLSVLNKVSALFRFYAAQNGRLLPTFRNKSIGPIFKGQDGNDGCPETSLRNYRSTLFEIPKQPRSNLHDGERLPVCVAITDISCGYEACLIFPDKHSVGQISCRKRVYGKSVIVTRAA
jgi:hypothetical protein